MLHQQPLKIHTTRRQRHPSRQPRSPGNTRLKPKVQKSRDAGRGTNPTPLLGWAGWDQAGQALALGRIVTEAGTMLRAMFLTEGVRDL
jgi:hypothetical protein